MEQELPSILSGVYVLKLFCVVLRGQLSIFLVFSCLLVITLLVLFTLPNISFAIYNFLLTYIKLYRSASHPELESKSTHKWLKVLIA